MSEDPAACLPAMSLHLSRTLDEIGLNSLTVKRRRKTYLVSEQMRTWKERIKGEEFTVYHFGSQTEGTTTTALSSDVDFLVCVDDVNVIRDMAEWERGTENLLMLQENTAPGYCRLQVLRSDIPVAREDLPGKDYMYDDRGRVIMKNTRFHGVKGQYRNGPAISESGTPNIKDNDVVGAWKCKSWPTEVEEFTRRTRRYGWPSKHLLHEAIQHGIFLVAVGDKLSPTEPLEWRTSASMAGRCLMFSLTIVHIKCYVILKMLVKTFVEPHVEKCISSYHCKTALFHCTENTEATFWRDDNLMQCVVRCLKILHAWVTDEFCPNYILQKVNLFAGKVTVHNKDKLQSILTYLIRRNEYALLQIQEDDLGLRLQAKLNTEPSVLPVLDSTATMLLMGEFEISLRETWGSQMTDILFERISEEPVPLINSLFEQINLLEDRIRQSGKHEREAIEFLITFLSCWLEPLLASVALSENRRIPPDALRLFPNGMNIDVASMLKLASILYCNGDLCKVDTILQSVEKLLCRNVTMAICQCYNNSYMVSLEFSSALYALKGRTARGKLFAHCVKFSPQEMYCAPSALRVEFYRAVGDDAQYRDPEQDRWMDLAVVDCLPYLYYLQYMTARHLGNHYLQSLQNLDRCVREEHGLKHLETALNLLGKCYEHELKPDAAMACYRRSLKIRPRNNAAKWHIAILWHRLVLQR